MNRRVKKIISWKYDERGWVMILSCGHEYILPLPFSDRGKYPNVKPFDPPDVGFCSICNPEEGNQNET